MLASASALNAYVGIAVDVVCFFMALLSFRGISTPSLTAQGEQRRSSLFNIPRDNPLYMSATGFLGVVSGMGVGESAVREIARAHDQDSAETARTVLVLRRACWATGLFGWVLAILFREQISTAMTGSPAHSGAIAWLGSIVLLGAINHGQLALLQGLRRISDLARANVLGALVGSLVVVLIYFTLGQTGIVPAIIATALASLGGSYWFARRIAVAPLTVNWHETWRGFRRLVGLGVAFMWGTLLLAALDIFTRSLITRKLGIEAAGIYQSAWALSGLFAYFVLLAMGCGATIKMRIARQSG